MRRARSPWLYAVVPTASDAPRSWRAWIPTASMTLVSLISYIDRNTLALLAPTVLADLHLSKTQYGWAISAFSVMYMLGNPLWGRTLDRAGVRVGMLVAVAIWSIASTAHAFTVGVLSLAAARAVLGFAEGATFPGGLRTVVQTLPLRRRALGTALAYSGGSIGAIVTPLLITPIAVLYGWRAAFGVTGLAGLAWLFTWAFVSRTPSLRAPAEVTTETQHLEKPPGPRDLRLWAFMAAYAFGGLPLAFVLYGAPIYLHDVMGETQSSLGKWLWIPPLGWELGYFFWGFATDRLATRGKDRERAFVKLFGAAAVLSLALAVVPFLPTTALAVAGLFFAMFIAAGFVIVSLAYATDAFTARHAAYLAGVGAGSWSALVAVIMPLFGELFDRRLFRPAFLVSAIAPLFGFVLWRLASTHLPRATDRRTDRA